MFCNSAAVDVEDGDAEVRLIIEAQADLRLLSAGRFAAPPGQAWERFYRIYQPFLDRILHTCRVPDASREDCLQEVWLAVLRAISSFDTDPRYGCLRAWLATLARRKAVDSIRRERRRAMQEIDEQMCSPDPGPAEIYERERRVAAVRRALAELRPCVPAEHFQIALWRWQEGRSLPEIAARLGLTFDQVHCRHRRLLAKLRRLLEAQGLDDGLPGRRARRPRRTGGLPGEKKTKKVRPILAVSAS